MQVTAVYQESRKAALVLRAVNNKFRLQLMRLLETRKEMNVTDIYVTLNWEQSVASQHLAILRRAGMVHERREGRSKYYSLNWSMLLFLRDHCQIISNHVSQQEVAV